jgi:hypothetical protein
MPLALGANRRFAFGLPRSDNAIATRASARKAHWRSLTAGVSVKPNSIDTSGFLTPLSQLCHQRFGQVIQPQVSARWQALGLPHWFCSLPHTHHPTWQIKLVEQALAGSGTLARKLHESMRA